MRCQVVGAKGVVGSMTKDILERLGHDVYGVDKGDAFAEEVTITFVCTPEDVVEEVVGNLVKTTCGIIVIRSTVPPGTCDKLAAQHKVHICSMPEHLREATALNDAWQPFYLVIGGCCPWCNAVVIAAFQALIGTPVIKASNTLAEMSKYVANNYLSTIITYWNEVKTLCDKVGVSPHILSKIVTHDPRIDSYGTIMGTGLTGNCLPKDLDAMITYSHEKEVEPILLDAVKKADLRVKEQSDGF